MNPRRIIFALLLPVAAVLHGCDSDGAGTSTGTSVADGGVSGTGITAGVTTGFGSIIVNGSVHQTDDAVLVRDGATIPGDVRDSFRQGEVVRVEWRLAGDLQRVAERVVYESELRGPLSASVDPTSKTLGVLAQQVTFDSLTRWLDEAGSELAAAPALSVCDRVEVSGYRVSGGGGLRATLVRQRAATDPTLRLNGVVESVGGTGSIFVSGLAVSIGPLPPPNPGDNVRIEGTTSCDPATGAVTATAQAIEVRPPRLAASAGEHIEIEGLITAFPVPDPDVLFDVAGVGVATTSETRFSRGAPVNLAVNVLVEVEGTVNSLGQIVADTVTFDGKAELRADIASVNPATASFDAVFGGSDPIPVTTNALTRFRDRTGTFGTGFGFADLMDGDHLEVEGYTAADGLVATEVELVRTGSASNRVIEAPVQDFDPPPGEQWLQLLDLRIDTSSLDDSVFRGGRAAFYEALSMDTQVEASGTESGGVLTWQRLELDD